MKIIFLDIDGVLNYGGCKDRAPSGCIGIDNNKVKLLADIVYATGAKIVLVSTWKFDWKQTDKGQSGHDALYMDKKLAAFGLKIHDKTHDRGFNRGEGIVAYLSEIDDYVDQWIVIDDEWFPDYHEYDIRPHLVKTSFYDEGLTEAHMKEAIAKLNYTQDSYV